MKGYKVFNPDWSCRKKQYSCPGTFEQEGKLKICENGIHFCKELANCFNYYDFNPENKVAEIEAIGEVIEDEIEVKYCTSKIKIIRELTWHEVLDLVNTGKGNTGFKNTGNRNTGDRNTGDCNTGNSNIGNRNTGNYNAGDRNTGDCNTGNSNIGNRNTGNYNAGDRNTGNYDSGYYNTGDCNTGYYNSGDYNSGSRNTGYYNSGSRNTGYYNSGDYNSGNHNSGNYNTGDYNIGDRNFGCFNTRKNNTKKNKIIFFDRQSDWTYENWVKSKAKKVLDKMNLEYLNWIPAHKMTEEEKEKHPEYKTTRGFLRYREKEELNSLRQKWWEDLSKEEKESILNLPNFDTNIFKEITGIDV